MKKQIANIEQLNEFKESFLNIKNKLDNDKGLSLEEKELFDYYKSNNWYNTKGQLTEEGEQLIEELKTID